MAYNTPIYTILVGGTSLSTGRFSGDWVTKLERSLSASVDRSVRVFNAGRGSQTSNWGVTQIPYWKNFRANAAILEFSINDSAPSLFPGGLAAHETNMNAIIDGLRENNPDIDITIQSMSPLGSTGNVLRPNLAGFYDLDETIAAAKSCRFLDNNADWLTAVRGANQYSFPATGWTIANDGLHPTEDRVAQVLLPNVRTLFGAIILDTVSFADSAPMQGVINSPYSWTPRLFGGTAPFVFTLIGTLPAGLTLNSSTGVISGTPTTPGTSTFSISVTDANAKSDLLDSVSIVVIEQAIYIGGGSVPSSGNLSTVFPAAAVENDCVVCCIPHGGYTVRAGWNYVDPQDFNVQTKLMWKLVTAADLTAIRSGAFTTGSSAEAQTMVVYRNTSGLRLKQAREIVNVSTLSLPGFVKSADSTGLLIVFGHYFSGSPTPNYPAPATRRQANAGSDISSCLGDILPQDLYTNSSSITLTGLGNGFHLLIAVDLLQKVISVPSSETTSSLPAMTADNLPSGHTVSVSSGYGNSSAWRTFDGNNTTAFNHGGYWDGSNWYYDSPTFTRTMSTPFRVAAFGVTLSNLNSNPTTITLDARINGTWVRVHRETGITGWVSQVEKRFAIPSYHLRFESLEYRIGISGGSSGSSISLGEIRLYGEV